MSAVIAVKARDRFIIGHDSCVHRDRGRGYMELCSEPGIRKLAVWPSFAIGFVGDLRIPHWASKRPPLRRIEDLWLWSQIPAGPRWNGFRILIMFPNGGLYTTAHGYSGHTTWRGQDVERFRIATPVNVQACVIGCLDGGIIPARATQRAVRRALERGLTDAVRAPIHTTELPFGREFPPPYGPQGRRFE